jgi:hypothetical protein
MIRRTREMLGLKLKAMIVTGILALLAGTLHGAPVQYYSDGFESYDVGTHPALWGEISGVADDVVTDEWAANGAKSYVTSSPDGNAIKRPFVALADIGAWPQPKYLAYEATLHMEATAASSGIAGFFFVDPRDASKVAAENAVAFRLDGKVVWYGPTEVEIGAWVPGSATTVVVKVEINSVCKKADVYLDGVLAGDRVDAWPAVIPASSEYGAEVELNKWGFGLAENFAAAGPGRVFVDDVVIREFVPVIPAKVDFKPETLNLKSNGKVVTVFIALKSRCYSAKDIDMSTVYIKVGDATSAGALLKPTSVSRRGGKLFTRMVKFPRADVEAMLEPGENVEITVGGSLKTGESFVGTDKIRVINPGKGPKPK